VALHYKPEGLGFECRSQRPSGLRQGFVADHLLGIAASNPAGGKDVCALCVVQ
jgi:hypothetical protein